jgi:ABC-type bacteriocin/lantibiotic exporter with double-glycine peptidase domain
MFLHSGKMVIIAILSALVVFILLLIYRFTTQNHKQKKLIAVTFCS